MHFGKPRSRPLGVAKVSDQQLGEFKNRRNTTGEARSQPGLGAFKVKESLDLGLCAWVS